MLWISTGCAVVFNSLFDAITGFTNKYVSDLIDIFYPSSGDVDFYRLCCGFPLLFDAFMCFTNKYVSDLIDPFYSSSCAVDFHKLCCGVPLIALTLCSKRIFIYILISGFKQLRCLVCCIHLLLDAAAGFLYL